MKHIFLNENSALLQTNKMTLKHSLGDTTYRENHITILYILENFRTYYVHKHNAKETHAKTPTKMQGHTCIKL
jgi:hypothetical protein